MERSAVVRASRSGLRWALALASMVVACPHSSTAGIVTLGASDGFSNFQLDNLTASTGQATFNPNIGSGALTCPGAPFPTLNGMASDTSSVNTSQNPISTNFVSTASTAVSPFFGTATTDMLATVIGGNGASSARGGVFWLSDTTLADGLPNGSQGLASVSISTAAAQFTNVGPGSISISNPGALLSVSGTIGSDTSSYVAAGLTSYFTLSGGGQPTTTTMLGSIALAASRGGSSIATNGGQGGATSSSLNGGLLSATASSTNPGGAIILTSGETITFMATLTLISDPGSSITISSLLAPGFPTDPSVMPNFGVFAGGPSAAVPEPSTLALLAAGLLSAGFATRRCRARI